MFNDSIKRLWGFHPIQDAYLSTLLENKANLVPARVVFASHDQYRTLVLGQTAEVQAKVRGHFYHLKEDLPVVGDWVALEALSGDNQTLPIEACLPRLSNLKRHDSQTGYQTLIANVDYIGLVTSFNRDLNERRLERGLLMIQESGARPLIIINKCDLAEGAYVSQCLDEMAKRFVGVPLIACSAQSGAGIDEIISFFTQGQSVAFLGMSGVGKSTLINALVGNAHLSTSEIRESDSRGRHTTTHRELFQIAQGFWIIDNPGIKEFSFWGEDEILDRTFSEIAALILACRFSDCSHTTEPGCRVAEALKSEELCADRWRNYIKIRREIEFQANKGNKQYRSEKRKEYAKRSIAIRKNLKAKER